jgi:metallo-beta-lactamase class B
MIKRIKILTAFMMFFQFAGYAQSATAKIKVSDDIELVRFSPKAYLHVSVSEIEGLGKVSSNGLIFVDSGQAFLFDTPVTNEQTQTLISFIENSLHAKVSGFVPNHWHEDCMGGLAYLNKQGIKSYAHQKTIDIAKKEGLPLPEQGFTDFLSLKLNDTEIGCYYLGSGHSTDNIVVWVPSEKILFAGCMVKDIHSKTLGNLAEANVEEWLKTIEKVINKFPSAEIVIPGHGQVGGKELLVHTRELLVKELKQ